MSCAHTCAALTNPMSCAAPVLSIQFGLDYIFVYYLKESFIVFFRLASRVATHIAPFPEGHLIVWMGTGLEVIYTQVV